MAPPTRDKENGRLATDAKEPDVGSGRRDVCVEVIQASLSSRSWHIQETGTASLICQDRASLLCLVRHRLTRIGRSEDDGLVCTVRPEVQNDTLYIHDTCSGIIGLRLFTQRSTHSRDVESACNAITWASIYVLSLCCVRVMGRSISCFYFGSSDRLQFSAACLPNELTNGDEPLSEGGPPLPLATEPPWSHCCLLSHTLRFRFGLQPVDGNWVGNQSRKGGGKQPQVTFPPGVRVRLSGISLRNLSQDGDTRDRGVVVLAKDSS